MRKLKLITIMSLAMFVGQISSAFAQSSQEEIDLLQAAFGMEKKELIAGFIKADEASPFWGIYDSYETERKELGKKRIALLEKYAAKYANLSDEEIDAYMKEMMEIKTSTDKLIDTYYTKMKKGAGSKIAAQFYECENYLLSVIRVELLNNIPFFGELDDE